jgi:hypothetical protein
VRSERRNELVDACAELIDGVAEGSIRVDEGRVGNRPVDAGIRPWAEFLVD